MTTLLDTNILIKALDENSDHHDWALAQLEESKLRGPALVLDIVFCEFTVAMDSLDDALEAISSLDLERLTCDDSALFRAGKAFKQYRDENAGPKLNVLPDFLIGAAAETLNCSLMTTNPNDFRGYFPDVDLITP